MTATPPLPANISATHRLPKVAWAKGAYLHDVNGKTYIDGSGGPAVYCLGHANEEVNAAIVAQLDRLARENVRLQGGELSLSPDGRTFVLLLPHGDATS